MNWLLFMIILTAMAFLIYWSVSDLKQKRIRMHKEKYEQAIKGGDPHKINLARQEYHALIQPKRRQPVIHLATRRKPAKNNPVLIREAV